jgi:hypothetical protein
MIDFGNVSDHLTSENTCNVADIANRLQIGITYPSNFNDVFTNYVINLALEDASDILCKHCNRTIDVTHPVYIKATLCPNCGNSCK